MGDAVLAARIGERLRDVVLSHHVAEALGPIFPGDDLITHLNTEFGATRFAASTSRAARSPPWPAPARTATCAATSTPRAPRRSTRHGTWPGSATRGADPSTSRWPASTQLWRYDPKAQRIQRFAGSGYEALEDGPRLSAGMNQPSGLATDGGSLFVADAEASAVRQVGFAADAELATLVGTGLFDFGDMDGIGPLVRLQHPLGVAYRADATGGQLFLADTYNSKLKVLHLRSRSVTTLAGGFDEPGGLSLAGDKVFVADTNHHAIKVYDLATRRVTALTPKGL